jgi:hypothetical protein
VLAPQARLRLPHRDAFIGMDSDQNSDFRWNAVLYLRSANNRLSGRICLGSELMKQDETK